MHNFFAHEVEDKVALQPYQGLIKYTIRPLGNEKRYLLKLGTGLGKTYSAILALQNFAKVDLGAFVVSYQQELFRDELIKFNIDIPVTYYGYIELGNRLITEVAPGEFKINRAMIKSLFNGVIVFDEVQKCYSRLHDTLQYIYVHFIALLLRNRVTCVYLSATPLTYADEIRDFLSLMQSHAVYSETQDEMSKILGIIQDIEGAIQASTREKFVQAAIKRLLIAEDIVPESIITEELILDTCRNRVFYVPELVGKDVPRVYMQGQAYQNIPHLPIVTCEAPNSFKAPQALVSQIISQQDVSASGEQDIGHESLRHIQFDAKSIQTVINGLHRADPLIRKYCADNDIIYNAADKTLQGAFMQVANLQKYSPKFAKCIENVLTKQGKSFIYFNQVKVYGVQFICQALKENGLLEYGQSIQKNSICFRCRQSSAMHDNMDPTDASHKFQAYRFFRITGEEGMKYVSTLDNFNSPSNDRGQSLQVIVGSQRVVQGFNFLAVNHVYILSFPFNVPNLIQVMGRAVRNRSHATLPEELQFVEISILVNGFARTQQDINYASREEIDIYQKCIDHRAVLEYERVMHKVSIDVPVYGSRFIANQTESLKMLSFNHEQPYIKPQVIQDPAVLLSDQYSMNDYYYSSIALDVLRHIRDALQNRFAISRIWHCTKLIESVKAASVYPSLKGVSDETILAVVYADPGIVVFGDYISSADRDTMADFRFAQDAKAEMPDIDFFLPGASIHITPLVLQTQQQGSDQDLRDLFLYFSRESPLILQYILAGKQSLQISALMQQIDSRKVFGLVRAVMSARLADVDSLLAKTFTPVTVDVCKEHAQVVRVQSSKSAVCPQCIRAAQQRELLADDADHVRLLFTLITHTAVTDADSGELIGYLAQDHLKILLFNTQKWQYANDFDNTLTDSPLLLKSKSIAFRIAGHGKHILRCPGISAQEVKRIATIYNYNRISNCQQLADTMWLEELGYRLGFICKKIAIWKDFGTQLAR